MFDLIGVVSFERARPEIPRAARLPATLLDGAGGSEGSFDGEALAARWASHPTTPRSHHHDGARHVLVVGEAWLRRDRGLGGRPAPGPLDAAEIAALRREQPDAFLERLKGNFTLAFVDEDRRAVELYNGRYGISPFYYAALPDRFVFSTSLGTLAAALPAAPGLDPAGVAELALFNYPVGARTYFRSVASLRAAEAVRASADGVGSSTWWDVRTLYDAPPIPEADALDAGSDMFGTIVRDFASSPPDLTASLTSGFDSRAIWAVLGERPGMLGYSFGTHGSLNVTIPERMAADLGLRFEPIYLEDEYEAAFARCADRALLLSDCLSTVERANYPYAFEKLGRHSPVVITGVFGSELLRTFQNVGLMFTAPMSELVRAGGPVDPAAVLASAADGYVDMGADGGLGEQIAADLAPLSGPRFEGMTGDQRFYLFLLTEGLRKYFGAEVHMERPWATNRFPFLDDEFVEFAFRAPFSGVHSRPLEPTVGNRFRSQHFYAHVIRRHRPELLRYPTDHGYPPSDLLAPLSLLRVGTKFAYRRWRKNRSGYREFKTEEWTERLYRERLDDMTRPEWLTDRFVGDLRTGAWKERRADFAKAASLALWLDLLGRA